MAPVVFTCPACGAQFDAEKLKMQWGWGAGRWCPECHERVRYSNPYGRLVAILSLFIAVGILFVMGVRSAFWYFAGTALIWVPISLYLNAASVHLKRPSLKKWVPSRGGVRRSRHKTFFEWLYERDEPPKMFDRRNQGDKG